MVSTDDPRSRRRRAAHGPWRRSASKEPTLHLHPYVSEGPTATPCFLGRRHRVSPQPLRLQGMRNRVPLKALPPARLTSPSPALPVLNPLRT